jgi:large subunit ribosomal protein L25
MTDINLNAKIRADVGKGASRRLRHNGEIPAIVYGAKKPNQSLVFNHNQVVRAMESEDFFTQILTIDVDGAKDQVVLKDLQRHPYKPIMMHIDFLRISATEKLTMRIPIHILGDAVAPGVKAGGVLARAMSEIEIRCLPADLPKYIEIDVSNMQLNSTIHLSDIQLPKGVEIAGLVKGSENDQSVITLHTVTMQEEEAPTPTTEVITEKAAEGAEGAAAAPASDGKEGKKEKE